MTSRITAICYHYIKRNDEFSRVWGHSLELFKEHVAFFEKEWIPIGVDELAAFVEWKDGAKLPAKCSILTFDDGLKEHSELMGPYLADRGISGLFNVCTEVLLKREPIMIQVLHYGAAYFGVRKFGKMMLDYIAVPAEREEYRKVLKNSDELDVIKANLAIKHFFNKHRKHAQVLGYLRTFWHAELERVVPDIFDRVFMNEDDVRKLVSMGHTVGLHTASHADMTDANMDSDKDMPKKEIVDAKRDLEGVIGRKVECFAYPFGQESRYLKKDENRNKLEQAGLKFIFNSFFNGDPKFRPDQIGRYLTQSKDGIDVLQSQLWSYEISHPDK